MLVPITESKAVAKVSSYHYISIPTQVYTDLCAFVDHYDTEVSGCGMVERIEHRFKAKEVDEPDTVEIEFAIKEVYLPKEQSNSGASTYIDDDVIAELVTDLLKQGKDTEHLRLHWHSHADMDTFHSGTDEDNYATLSNGDFLVSLVINKAHKFLGRVDYFKPIRVTLTELGVHMQLEIPEEASQGAVESMAELDKNTADTPSYRYVSAYKDDLYSGYDEKWNNWSGNKKDRDEVSCDYDFEEDMQVADALQIPRQQAVKFRNCKQTNCHACKNADKCQEYLYSIDKLPII